MYVNVGQLLVFRIIVQLNYILQLHSTKKGHEILDMLDVKLSYSIAILRKMYPQKMHEKKMKSTSSHRELVLMFPKEKRKKWRFWIHLFVARKQQHGEFHRLIQESKLSCIFQDVSLSSCW